MPPGWQQGNRSRAYTSPIRASTPTARNGFSGQTKVTRPQRSGCSPRPKPPFARVGRARASVSVLVRVPYSAKRRSTTCRRGGLRIFSHQGRGLHCEQSLRARDPSPGSRRRPPSSGGVTRRTLKKFPDERGPAYHHVLSASGANTALLQAQKPTRVCGRHGQTEAWGVGYTPSAGGG